MTNWMLCYKTKGPLEVCWFKDMNRILCEVSHPNGPWKYISIALSGNIERGTQVIKETIQSNDCVAGVVKLNAEHRLAEALSLIHI